MIVIWKGGIVIYGVIIGGAIVVLIFVRFNKIFFW